MNKAARHPLAWVPTLYLAQGLPFYAVALFALLAVGIYRRRLPEQPIPDNLLVKAGRRTLRLPSPRYTAPVAAGDFRIATFDTRGRKGRTIHFDQQGFTNE